MNMDDMILVSIDDHSIEPGDMYKNHVPAKWADQVPKIVQAGMGEFCRGHRRPRLNRPTRGSHARPVGVPACK